MINAILAMLTVWTLPNGDPVYGKACRRQQGGCEEHIAWAVQTIDYYSTLNRLGPELAAAVAFHETRYSVTATSSIGAWGILQLHPKSKWGRSVAKACRALRVPRTHRLCQELVIAEGVALLARCVDKCGSVPEALGLYSSGKCVSNGYARQVLRVKKELEGEDND